MNFQPAPWLMHPLAEELVRFNLLPSSGCDPRHLTLLGLQAPEGLEHLPSYHRHASGEMLRQWGLPPVSGFDDPALPVAMANAPLFERLGVYCGVVILGPAIRRVITRVEVRALEAQLGTAVLQFARGPARALWHEDALPGNVLAPDLLRQAEACGTSLLMRALESASDAVGRRGRLRLPPESPSLALPASLDTPPAALALARAVLAELDPEWLSFFPALH